MSCWSECECTFLSNETHIQLYKVVHSELFSCTSRESMLLWHVLDFHLFCLKCVPVIQVWVLLGLRLDEKETSTLERPCPPTHILFFSPLHFSHLICSSSCWRLSSRPSPFIPPIAPPTYPPTLHPQTRCPAHTVSPSTSTSLTLCSPSAKLYRSPGRPWFSTLTATSVSKAVVGACCGRRVLLFLHEVCVFSLHRQ